jgi:hypothetical protein
MYQCCEMLQKRLACSTVWQHGALAEALELELEMATGTTDPDSILKVMGTHARRFTQAMAIAFPLKAFLRYLLQLSIDWVRSVVWLTRFCFLLVAAEPQSS